MGKKRKLRKIGQRAVKISIKAEKEFTKKVDDFHKKISEFTERIDSFLLDLKKEQTEMSSILNKVNSTNENVETTLCNVLLAIRQNEYLQAWYPNENNYGKSPQNVVNR